MDLNTNKFISGTKYNIVYKCKTCCKYEYSLKNHIRPLKNVKGRIYFKKINIHTNNNNNNIKIRA